MLAILDGPSVDDGTACEIGMFHALMQSDASKKGIVGLLTDIRRHARRVDRTSNLLRPGCDRTTSGQHRRPRIDEARDVLRAWAMNHVAAADPACARALDRLARSTRDGSQGGRATIPAVRRYHVTTFGCQMNAHDSERIKGMLESLGLGETTEPEDADVLVFNTCTIREKPDTKLAAYLGEAAARKRRHPDLVVAVGGCYAEAQRERIFERYPFVDVAFGPGSIPHLGEWIETGGYAVPRGRFGTHDTFAATLPMHRERRFSAWVQVSMGCNSKCAYCIVPAVRGREQSRRPGEIVAEVEALARDGVREVTLLGQNVNSWGRDLAPDVQTEFGELLRACDAVEGIERIRFTSPHPKDFREPVIAAIAECRAVCEHVHLPLQSGSLADPQGDAPHVHARAVPGARRQAARRDPGPRARYRHHRRLPRRDGGGLSPRRSRSSRRWGSTARSRSSTRRVPGTEAAAMADQVPEDVKRERMERLVDVVQRAACRAERGARRAGRGGPRRGAEPHRSVAPPRPDARNTTVNFHGYAAPGDLVAVEIESATSTTLRGRERAPVAA